MIEQTDHEEEQWERSPLWPVLGFESKINAEVFRQGVELARVAIELAKLKGESGAADYIGEARELVFQCIKSIGRSDEEDRRRFDRNIERRFQEEPPREEAAFWGKQEIPCSVNGQPYSFKPYSEERKWNDFLRSHCDRCFCDVMKEEWCGLPFADWLVRELNAGRSLPDCLKRHEYGCRVQAAGKAWEERRSGDGWLVAMLARWRSLFIEDWYLEMKKEFRQFGVSAEYLRSLACSRWLSDNNRGKPLERFQFTEK